MYIYAILNTKFCSIKHHHAQYSYNMFGHFPLLTDECKFATIELCYVKQPRAMAPSHWSLYNICIHHNCTLGWC